MRQYIFSIMILAAFLFSACGRSDDFRISSSIFIPDTDNPGLPIYSEWGYNAFGAYLDRTPITSDDVLMPVKIIVKNDTCQIAFIGRVESRRQEFMLAFHLADYAPKTFFDLLSLDGKRFDLAEDGVMVVFRGYKSDTLRVTDGELNVKRVQKLLVDKEDRKVVLSGTFSLKSFVDNDDPVSINSARFDVGVDDKNFFLNP